MKLLPTLLICAFLLPAQTQPDIAGHKAFMDSVQDLKDRVEDSLNGSPDQAVAAAGKLIEALQKERQFWKEAGVPQGAQFASVAADRVSSLKEAVAHSDPGKARQIFKTVSTACSECHDAHLEQTLSSKH